MPSYVTHGTFAQDLAKRVQKKCEFELSPENMRTYGIGADFMSATYPGAHTKKTDVFFLEFIRNIKTFGYQYNPFVVSYLYGHISHYFLDVSMHPYIYWLEKETTLAPDMAKMKHLLIEGAIDHHYLEECGVDSTEVGHVYLQGSFENDSLLKCIQTTYHGVYGCRHVLQSYKATLGFLKAAEKVRCIGLENFGTDIYRVYLETNKMTSQDVLNTSRMLWESPFTHQQLTLGIGDLYGIAMQKASEAIFIVNEVLYDDRPIEDLQNVFTGLSYLTGVPCEVSERNGLKKALVK